MAIGFFLVECGKVVDSSGESLPAFLLPNCPNDLGKFEQFALTFSQKSITSLTSDESILDPTYQFFSWRSNIIEQLNIFCEEAKTLELCFIFFAGHGLVKGGTLHLVPVDYRPGFEDETCITLDYFLDKLSSLRGKVIVALDCCRVNANISPLGAMEQFSVRLSEQVHLLMGCSDGQSCFETGQGGINGGIFTEAFLHAVRELTPECTISDVFERIVAKQDIFVADYIKTSLQTPRLLSIGDRTFGLGAICKK